MPVISRRFADELNEKEMRDAYLEEKTRAKLALQIRENRFQRGWSQAELGQRMGKTQSNIHRLEDRDVARYTLTTLLEFASAYDCGLVAEFVPYEEFLRRTNDLSPENLRVPSFTTLSLVSLYQDIQNVTFSYDIDVLASTHHDSTSYFYAAANLSDKFTPYLTGAGIIGNSGDRNLGGIPVMPTEVGTGSVMFVNSSGIETSASGLTAEEGEIDRLKMIIEQKDRENEDLKKANSWMLSYLTMILNLSPDDIQKIQEESMPNVNQEFNWKPTGQVLLWS